MPAGWVRQLSRLRSPRKSAAGFTLIEILLVIALIAILAAIVIVAINPARQYAQARDAQRQADVQTIVNAIYQYALDNNGEFPGDLTTDDKELCRTGTPLVECDEDSYYNVTVLSDNETYLVALPLDPLCDGSSPNSCSPLFGTGYFANLTTGGRVRVVAFNAELSSIEVIR